MPPFMGRARCDKVTAGQRPVAYGQIPLAPEKLASYNTHVNPPGINGQLVEGRIVYDAFVLDNKKMAIYYVENKATE